MRRTLTSKIELLSYIFYRARTIHFSYGFSFHERIVTSYRSPYTELYTEISICFNSGNNVYSVPAFISLSPQ